MTASTQTRKVLPVTEEVLEAALVGYYQCLVCLRIFNDETKCRCSREDRQEKMNSFIALHYGAERLPPPIRRLMYPDYVPPALPPARATSPPPPSSEVLVPQTPQIEEPSTSTCSKGREPAETFTGRRNASSGVFPVPPKNTFNGPTTSTRRLTSSTSSFSLSGRGGLTAEAQVVVAPEVPRKPAQDLSESSPPLPDPEPPIFEEASSHLEEQMEPSTLDINSTSRPRSGHAFPGEETAAPAATSAQIRAQSGPSTKHRIASSPRMPVSSSPTELPTKNGDPPTSSKTTPPSLTKRRPSIPLSVRQRYNLKRNENRYSCIFCGRIYSRGYLLDDHIRGHIKETPFECPHCGKGFSMRDSWNSHINYHCHVRSQERPYSCPVCQKTFRTKFNMTNHRYTHLESSKRILYRCSLCPATFRTPEGLRYHTSAKHNKTAHKCEQCGKLFAQVGTLRVHVVRRHQKIKAHTCLFCENTFVTNHELFEHLRRHTRERPFPCPKCGKCFKQSSHLRYHLQVTHPSKKESKGLRHCCVFCGKTFVLNCSLHSHLCVHIQEKWFWCRICGTQFASRGTMLRHVRHFHKK